MDPSIKDRPLLTSLGQKMREIDSEVWITPTEKKNETNLLK
jgi:hypothetical protein